MLVNEGTLSIWTAISVLVLSMAQPLESVMSILKVFTWTIFLGFTTLSHLILNAP